LGQGVAAIGLWNQRFREVPWFDLPDFGLFSPSKRPWPSLLTTNSR